MLKFRAVLSRTWVALLIAGSQACTTPLSKEGAGLRIITENERTGCESLGIVSGSMSMGANMGEDMQSATNQAMNRAAAKGADSVRLLNTQSTVWGSTATVEALRCGS